MTTNIQNQVNIFQRKDDIFQLTENLTRRIHSVSGIMYVLH